MRLFNQSLNEACPTCREEEEDAYSRLFDYMGHNPKASLPQASAATGVEEDVIRRMIRSGRLIGFESLAMSVLTCQRCGTPLVTGKFCSVCRRELRSSFTSTR